MKSKSPTYYSSDKLEAIKNGSFICSYHLTNNNKLRVSDGILVYGMKKGLLFDKIQKNKMKLSIRFTSSLKNNIYSKDVYWEASYKGKKITTFEDKEVIGLVGLDKNMDTIILKPNKEDTFYIIKE